MFDHRLSQLKSLQNSAHGPSNEALERGLLKLRATMAAHPMKLFVAPETPWWVSPFVWKPATALAMALAIVGSSALTVSAAGSSAPGDRLYGVKILTEEVRGRLTFSSEDRFRVLAKQAENRLAEADAVIRRSETPIEQKEERLVQVMKRYEAQVAALKELARNFIKSDKPEKVQARVAVVDSVLQHHTSLVDSTSTTELKTKNAVEAPVKDVLELAETISANNEPVHHESEEEKEAEHVDAEAPKISLPQVHQPSLITRGESRQWKKAENKIEKASVR